MFSKLITCKHCGRNFKAKIENKKRIYVCSSYDNYGKNSCERNAIEENFLKGLVQRRFQREMTDEEIRDVIEYIEVENSLLLEIHLKDQESIMLGRQTIRF